jgi:SOS-response transcriptional repressor LexA
VTERSTKRQKELLMYVDAFIKEHGYGPSYREVMNGLGYKSVSTVAVHIDGLISKGYLRKRDNSARSLEVVSSDYKAGSGPGTGPASAGGAAKEKWLVEAVNDRFGRYEQAPTPQLLDELYVLIGALKVLGFEAAYDAMRIKLGQVVQR